MCGRIASCIVAHLVPNVFFESNYSMVRGLQPYGQVQFEMYMDTDLLKEGMICIWCDCPSCANLTCYSCPPKKRKWFKQDAQINTMKNLKGNQQYIYIPKHSSKAGKHQTRSTRTEKQMIWTWVWMFVLLSNLYIIYNGYLSIYAFDGIVDRQKLVSNSDEIHSNDLSQLSPENQLKKSNL